MKRGCLPVALEELKNKRKKAFIVTDAFLYEHGYTRAVTDRLDEMGILTPRFSGFPRIQRCNAPERAPGPWRSLAPTA